MDVGPAWGLITSSPWVMALFVLGTLVIVTRVYLRLRWAHLEVRGRDPVRRFGSHDRAVIKARAGNRCEHHFFYVLRCPERDKLQADHVHPHSRGGSTTLGNAQALCAFHNRAKGARIPFTWELRLLQRRRETYFPGGANAPIVRRSPSS